MIDFLTINGDEVINSHRLQTYIKNGYHPSRWQMGECGCPELQELLDEVYSNPRADDAPWVDNRIPESYDFAGILLLSVEGLEDGSTQRSVTNVINGGAIIGREQCISKNIRFTGMPVGATCCAIEYGLTWFRNALRGSDPVDCSGPCGGDTIEFLKCCPDCTHVDGFTINTCGIEAPEVEVDFCDCYDRYARCMHNVSLTSGPRVIERQGNACGRCGGCPMKIIEWTITAGNPAMYGPTTCLVEKERFASIETSCTVFTSEDPDDVDCDPIDNNCTGAEPCELEVACGTIPTPPVPDDPFRDCSCTSPLDTIVGQPFSIENVSCYSEMVPIIKVYAGSEELRNFSIHFFENNLERDCRFFLDSAGRPNECIACSVINVTYLPADSLLEINGETGQAQIQCQGGVITPAFPVLFGKDGTLFDMPTLACTNYCVIAIADADHVNDETFWSMCLSRKEL